MKKKLTLTIEESVSERAKKIAKREGTSVSQWVEELLREKTSEAAGEWMPKPGSWTEKMLSSVKSDAYDKNRDYKKLKESEIMKKYDV